MKREMQRIFERFALAVTLTHNGTETATHGLLQPMERDSGEEPFTPGRLGETARPYWRFFAAADVPLAVGDGVQWDGRSFSVRRTETVYAGREAVCRRAILREEAEA